MDCYVANNLAPDQYYNSSTNYVFILSESFVSIKAFQITSREVKIHLGNKLVPSLLWASLPLF